ncbi:hypothetical protein [Saccharospirillum salsuginis]|uniref:Uncharacterized protein n=1 Tax=Saccharospirillum salsuginis TaxID=418750 RepID=A0A918NE12_9GAMM|nr:hypothetical protein [Saccharospirillum salsuginis]GGX60353.1 hypothetical protein GCM10007392_30470 [Saccharospirillum salsuginis]
MGIDLLLIPQNSSHAENFAFLTAWCQQNQLTYKVLILDKLMKQETVGYFDKSDCIVIDAAPEMSFYRMGYFERIKFLVGNREKILESVPMSKVIVAGNDGAIQRLIFNSSAGTDALKILMIDGNLTPFCSNTLKWKAKAVTLLHNGLGLLGLGYLSPSLVGHSKVDKVYVMNKHVKEVLQKQGSKNDIDVLLPPRFYKFLSIKSLQKKHGRVKNILYGTTAYSWHRLWTFSELQKKEVYYLLNCANQFPEKQFHIRVHPRDDKSFYENLSLPANVSVGFSDVTLSDDITWADLLWISRSSLAFEARLAGLPCIISEEYFPKPDVYDYLSNDDNITYVDDIDEYLKNIYISFSKSVSEPTGEKAYEEFKSWFQEKA